MIKKIIHNCLRAFGVDIVSLNSIDREIASREQERKQARLHEIKRLRSDQKIVNLSSAGSLIWTTRDELFPNAIRHIASVDVILDIGCAFRPQQFVEAKTHICCEPFHEYMDRLLVETAGESKYVYLTADFTAASHLFPESSVDSIFLTDVIEHIDREVGLQGLERLKKIARKQIVLFTPLGFMDQDPGEDGVDPWGMGGMEFQKHRSGWTPDDFPASVGWTVIACKDFHQVDGYERAINEPFGAFWAIWNSGR